MQDTDLLHREGVTRFSFDHYAWVFRPSIQCLLELFCLTLPDNRCVGTTGRESVKTLSFARRGHTEKLVLSTLSLCLHNYLHRLPDGVRQLLRRCLWRLHHRATDRRQILKLRSLPRRRRNGCGHSAIALARSVREALWKHRKRICRLSIYGRL